MTETMKTGQIADLLGVTERGARDLLAAAGARPAARGTWPHPGALRAVFQHLRSARRTTEIGAARTEHLRAQAERTRLATARQARRLIPLEDAIFAIDTVSGAAREEIAGLPARLTRDRQARAAAEAEVRQCLERIAGRLAAAAAALKTGAMESLEGHDDD